MAYPCCCKEKVEPGVDCIFCVTGTQPPDSLQLIIDKVAVGSTDCNIDGEIGCEGMNNTFILRRFQGDVPGAENHCIWKYIFTGPGQLTSMPPNKAKFLDVAKTEPCVEIVGNQIDSEVIPFEIEFEINDAGSEFPLNLSASNHPCNPLDIPSPDDNTFTKFSLRLLRNGSPVGNGPPFASKGGTIWTKQSGGRNREVREPVNASHDPVELNCSASLPLTFTCIDIACNFDSRFFGEAAYTGGSCDGNAFANGEPICDFGGAILELSIVE